VAGGGVAGWRGAWPMGGAEGGSCSMEGKKPSMSTERKKSSLEGTDVTEEG
jgi:hypothetical protein